MLKNNGQLAAYHLQIKHRQKELQQEIPS